MLELAGKTVNKFRYDETGNVVYTFNNEGYRSTAEFNDFNPIIIIGNSISFGLGVSYDQTFGKIIEDSLNHPVYNFSIGAYRHSNFYQLDRLKFILNYFEPKHIIFQINNLINIHNHGVEETVQEQNKSIAEKIFKEFWQELCLILAKYNHSIIYYDDIEYCINEKIKEKFLIHNRYKVDNAISTLNQTFGPKTHKLIAIKLLTVLK
jgi:hypothetical protein